MERMNFDQLVEQLEQGGLRGKRVADIPDLAAPRLKYRRSFYRWASVHFAMAIFNFILATSQLVGLWPLNALCAGLAVFMMIFCEYRARELSRQLHRRASEQVARDLMEIRG